MVSTLAVAFCTVTKTLAIKLQSPKPQFHRLCNQTPKVNQGLPD